MSKPKLDSTENPKTVPPDKSLDKIHKGLLVPLRINRNLVIYTKPENCNEAYRKEYIRRIESNFIY